MEFKINGKAAHVGQVLIPNGHTAALEVDGNVIPILFKTTSGGSRQVQLTNGQLVFENMDTELGAAGQFTVTLTNGGQKTLNVAINSYGTPADYRLLHFSYY